MTTQELENFLVGEKQKTEKRLRCDMCKKYGRCLFCSKSDQYPCASAYGKFMEAKADGMKIPAMVFPEPAVPEDTPVAEPVTQPSAVEYSFAVPAAAQPIVVKPATAAPASETRPAPAQTAATQTATTKTTVTQTTVRSVPQPAAKPAPAATTSQSRPVQTQPQQSVRTNVAAPVRHEEEDGKLETVSEILSDYRMKAVSKEREDEYRKMSVVLNSTERVTVRTPRKETDVPVLILRKK